MSALHVLGTCAGWPEARRACAGYVLECDGAYLVLDLGFATLPRLLSIVPRLESIVGVCVSHTHPDHVSDLIGLCRAAQFGHAGVTWPLVGPPGARQAIAAGDPEEGASLVDTVFPSSLVRARIGPFEVASIETAHYLPNFAYRIESPNATVVYTGDTGPNPDLANFAKGCDILLCECTDRFQSGGDPDPDSRRFLMTATEAGTLARDADVDTLVLTHFWPGNDRQRSASDAAEMFAGRVVVAHEGDALLTNPTKLGPDQIR